jgi:NAD(P)-dependent dehydrogenase (short-subunit alcohol dehydrogenase family)
VHGPITVLVNNAANDKRHETLQTDETFWDWSMAVNLRSYFFACQSVIPGMKAAGGGSIINFSSISFMMADKGYAAYITANAGIVGLTRTLAREFGPDRVRVNAVAPGWVLTERQKEHWVTPEGLAAHLERQCLPDPIQPEDVTGTVLFLASEASKMMTSQTLILDGGFISS